MNKKAYYRGIPCYFDPETNTLEGRNRFYNWLVGINIYIDFEILELEELPIYIENDEK